MENRSIMPLSADTLLDRLHLKRQITRWRLATLAVIVLSMVAIIESDTGQSSGASPMERAYIARYTLEGMVLDDPERDALLAGIRDNPKIKALVVRMDTPGGSAVAGQEIYLQLREIAAKKPVVVVMRDLSASAGYLAAIGADRIFAREATLTGSIGVIIEAAELTELADKIGVTPITIKTGPMKDALSPTAKITPEARQVMQGVVDDFFHVFVDTIAERRALPRDEVLKMADGRVFTGRQALKNKLIDALGNEQDAVAWLESEKKLDKSLPIKELKVKKEPFPEFLQHFADSAMQKILPGASSKLDGLVAIWHPALQLQ